MSMYLAASPFSKSEPIARATSSPFQASVTLRRVGLHRLERLLADEVVVELHEAA